MRGKRIFDLALLLPVLPIYALALGALALLVWLLDGRPVFFLQRRAGRQRIPFVVFKLRTMTAEPDPRDRRPTRLGALLRRRGLDELPQLLNVLRGQMSLVGPRPLAVEDAQRLVAAHPPFAARFDLPPGLTGPAQVANLRGVHATAVVEAAYAKQRTALGDLAILLRTTWINVAGKPAAVAKAPVGRPGRWLMRFAWLTGGLLIAWLCVGHEVNRLRRLHERGGAAAFGRLDLASASALNVIMALGGYLAGYTEVADETLLLFAPSATGERDFESDFAMRSPEVRRAARALAERVARGEAHPSMRVFLADEPLAVRLAFSLPLELQAERTPAGLAFTARTAIVYPRHAVTPLGPGPTGERILFDEGIYWVLQQRGWFHPYFARWHWTLSPDDARWSRSPAGPERRERATAAVWHLLVSRAPGVTDIDTL